MGLLTGLLGLPLAPVRGVVWLAEQIRSGTVQAGTPTRVLGRSGEWVRVQLEGWVRAGDLQSASGAAFSGVTAAEVRSDPASVLGRHR